jgi:dinuclear metal center YbgI/SA1388 family protein
VEYLDEYLSIPEWSDKALNGLQVEGAADVDRVAVATDAALATFSLAAEAGAQFLIVHHGLFWGRPEPVAGPLRARLAALIEADLSLYAAHLPLDTHAEVGHNAVIADLLGMEDRQPFGLYGGREIGWSGRLEVPLDRAELGARLEALLGARPDVLGFGTKPIETVAVVSGDGAELIPQAAAAGVDAFVTGETSHIAWHSAREHRIDVLFCGHYASETVGVRALGDHLAERFDVESVFLESPTGY